jgi:hypothetical protein
MIYLSLSRRFEIEHDFLLFYVRAVFLRIPPTDFRTYAVKTYKSMQVFKLCVSYYGSILTKVAYVYGFFMYISPIYIFIKNSSGGGGILRRELMRDFLHLSRPTDGRTDRYDKPGSHPSHNSLRTCLKIKRRICLSALIELMQATWRWVVTTVDRSKYGGAFSILACV